MEVEKNLVRLKQILLKYHNYKELHMYYGRKMRTGKKRDKKVNEKKNFTLPPVYGGSLLVHLELSWRQPPLGFVLHCIVC